MKREPWYSPTLDRVAYVGAQGHKDTSRSKGSTSSRTVFPFDFLTDYERLYGRGFTPQDVASALPNTPGLFSSRPSPAQSMGQTAPSPSGERVGFGQGAPTDGPFSTNPDDVSPPSSTPAAGQHMVRAGDVYRLASSLYSDEKDPTLITGTIRDSIQKLGFNPDGDVPEAVVRKAFAEAEGQFRGGGASRTRGTVAENVLPGLLSQYFELQDARATPQPFAQNAPQVGVDVQGGIQRLGFGNAQPEIAGNVPGMIREAPKINAPDVGNAQMNIAPEGFKQYGEDIFQSLYNPVAREERRTGAIQDRQLQAELAQAGIQSSGAGFGQLQTQRNERQQRIFAAAEDAASRASVARFGAEFDQNKQNAMLRQDQNLKRADLDFEAQRTNADNILRGDATRSDAYLRAIGLDTNRATLARNDFLALLDLQERDLARLDKSAQDRLALSMDAWLKQFAAISNAGQISSQTTSSQGKNAGGGVQVYGSGGSGGGSEE